MPEHFIVSILYREESFFFLQLMSTSLGITVLGVRVYGGGAAGEVARQLAHSTADGVYAIHTAEG